MLGDEGGSRPPRWWFALRGGERTPCDVAWRDATVRSRVRAWLRRGEPLKLLFIVRSGRDQGFRYAVFTLERRVVAGRPCRLAVDDGTGTIYTGVQEVG